MDFKELLGLAISEKCAASILSFNFEDVECIKLTISKLLSYGILLGSVLVKVPQIVNILRAKSAKGISLTALIMETVSITILLAYNAREKNPLSTYGELGFLTIQNMIIMMLILIYQDRAIYSATLFFVFSRAVSYLMDPAWVSDDLMIKLQLSTIFIGITSKLPQIFSNFQAKSTGQLSSITAFLQFAGSGARILTTVQEVDDINLIVNSCIAAFLNGVIFAQILIYGPGPADSTSQTEEEKEHETKEKKISEKVIAASPKSRKKKSKKD